ncbi:MAG: GNAT family N-acetyltransferase [Conexibacteraceae bacterium]|nr:GNAT family N-acetyltransferase [Conexibacteraceae bacterium]
MTDQPLIRPAQERDCEFITGLVPSLLEFGSPGWDDANALAPGFRDVLAAAVRAQDPQSRVLVAEGADGTRLGFISLRVGTDAVGAARGHVADIAVIAEARRMGVGSALMQAAEAWARERGLPSLSLDVWSTNEPALAFYRRLGYTAESLSLVKPVD